MAVAPIRFGRIKNKGHHKNGPQETEWIKEVAYGSENY
jgi:hypothetical protein